MSILTDLEICKRIAEIEGFEHYKLTDQGYMAFNEGINHSITDRTFFNPLTDDALCFQLMVKYDIDLMSPYRKNGETKWEAQIFSKDYADAFSIHDESPNRAICLAIIEANKLTLQKEGK